MTIKSALAKATARVSHFTLQKIFHRGGTALPGKLAIKVDPNVLDQVQTDFDLVIVTGTNGKTLTTALITRVLTAGGYAVLTNPSGSNMVQGITGTLLTTKVAPSKNGRKPVAVLEVDEANVQRIAAALKPRYFVLTNIFRDQLDRYGEIYTTYDKIVAGIKEAPAAKVLTNADSPIFARGDFPNERIYYGFNHVAADEFQDLKAPTNTDGILSPTDNAVLHYSYITYANLGRYFSVSDGFKRPEPKYAVTALDELRPQFSVFHIEQTPFRIEIGGLYNIYNALAAYALGREFAVPDSAIKQAFEQNEQVFGRQESIRVGDKVVTLLLIKNPVGTNSVIDMMATDPEPFSLVTLLNANYADGIDTSWIWDAEFEKLHETNLAWIATGGERYRDITVRLKMANYDLAGTYPNPQAIAEAIQDAPTQKVYLAATYTAMLQIREAFKKQGYLKAD
ncbi:Mur ligase family protein [Leuconostocaceae bacterium ESL0958]|nr:Mur ligase family protein [Leuconostocaceae bacterium ESL0958]